MLLSLRSAVRATVTSEPPIVRTRFDGLGLASSSVFISWAIRSKYVRKKPCTLPRTNKLTLLDDLTFTRQLYIINDVSFIQFFKIQAHKSKFSNFFNGIFWYNKTMGVHNNGILF